MVTGAAWLQVLGAGQSESEKAAGREMREKRAKPREAELLLLYYYVSEMALTRREKTAEQQYTAVSE
jgi:hypothetical protein